MRPAVCPAARASRSRPYDDPERDALPKGAAATYIRDKLVLAAASRRAESETSTPAAGARAASGGWRRVRAPPAIGP